jgi:hypothetical protein
VHISGGSRARMVTCLALVSLMVGGRHHCGGVVCRGRDHGVRRGARERGNSCLFVDNNPFSGLSQSSENEGNFWRIPMTLFPPHGPYCSKIRPPQHRHKGGTKLPAQEPLGDSNQSKKPGTVAHTCNPSYSGGRDQEDCSSKPAWAN